MGRVRAHRGEPHGQVGSSEGAKERRTRRIWSSCSPGGVSWVEALTTEAETVGPRVPEEGEEEE